MPIHRWSEIPKEQVNPLFIRQMIHTATMTIARMELRQGASVPEHAHHNEQVTTLEKGRMRFLLGGEEIILNAGESLHIPANVPHSAEVLEDVVAVDTFSPPREDWIRGDDAYLRR
ncbi:MAG: cupin domain-containing protein [Acidobacteriia bacterium]|nr:cupin domain-containing protein [Terriglobia bacterium]